MVEYGILFLKDIPSRLSMLTKSYEIMIGMKAFVKLYWILFCLFYNNTLR